MPICEIVVDKTSEAGWPPADAVVNGQTITLSSIFEPTLTVSLVCRNPNLVLSTNPCCPEELIDRMIACDQCSEPSWHAHLFVVGQVDYAKQRPAGMLLDMSSYRKKLRLGERRGCVVSWDATKAFSAGFDEAITRRLYFRLVAHEIGHLFCLGHEESSSLMTPLSWFRGRRGYPQNVGLQLSAAHRERLARTPIELLRPGGPRLPIG